MFLGASFWYVLVSLPGRKFDFLPSWIALRNPFRSQGRGLDDEVIDTEFDALFLVLSVQVSTKLEYVVHHAVNGQVVVRNSLKK